jgi:hypothetical protein
MQLCITSIANAKPSDRSIFRNNIGRAFSKQTLDLEGHFSPFFASSFSPLDVHSHRLSTLHGFAWYLDPLNTNVYMVVDANNNIDDIKW